MAKKNTEVTPALSTDAESNTTFLPAKPAVVGDAPVVLAAEEMALSQTDSDGDADTLELDEEFGDLTPETTSTQTDLEDEQFSLEMHDPEEENAIPSQTDLADDGHSLAFEPARTKEIKNMPLSQTDSQDENESLIISAERSADAKNLMLSQTDSEETASAAQVQDPGARELIELALSQTDSENPESHPEGAEFSRAIADEIVLPQDDLADEEKPASPTRSSGRRKKTSVSYFQSDTDRQPTATPDDAPDSTESAQEQSPTPRRRRARTAPVVPIDRQRTVETEADKMRNDMLDQVESQKGRKLLTGTIQGVERPSEDSELAFAVIYHGEFKVIIPAEEVVQPPTDLRGRSMGEVMHYLVSKRLGAEVDYVVKGVDAQAGIAAASRLEAMTLKKRAYYLGRDRNGNYVLNEGSCAEARVTSVIRPGIFVDLFGIETYIPLRELSYQRWIDATDHFQSGQRVLVKITELDRSDRRDIKVTASVKQAGENPYEKAFRRYKVGSRYVGTVSMVDTNGVFVSLEGGVDCLCTYPKRGRPPRGSRVTVRILGANQETNRIWGAITHMVTPR